MTTIQGYAYEADVYCVPCTKERFSENQGPGPQDTNGILLDQEDAEGNPVHPVFDGQEADSPQACYICHEEVEGINVLTYKEKTDNHREEQLQTTALTAPRVNPARDLP